MTPNFMVFVFARAVILILPEARRWGSVGRSAEPDWGLEAVRAGGVVTQNPRAGCISGVGIRPFFAAGCGDGGKFCDANRPIAPRRGRRQPLRGHRSGRWAGSRRRRRGRGVWVGYASLRFEVSIGAGRISIFGSLTD